MSGVVEIGISMTLLRGLIIGVLAVAAALLLRTLLADRRRPVRQVAWILLLAPYFTPVLLTGYAYANFSLSLIHHPAINAVFYSALLWWKFTPIAAVILHFTPAPISAEAIKVERLEIPHPGRLCRRAGCGLRRRFPAVVRRVRNGFAHGREIVDRGAVRRARGWFGVESIIAPNARSVVMRNSGDSNGFRSAGSAPGNSDAAY
jgi:hypothetical protein